MDESKEASVALRRCRRGRSNHNLQPRRASRRPRLAGARPSEPKSCIRSSLSPIPRRCRRNIDFLASQMKYDSSAATRASWWSHYNVNTRLTNSSMCTC